MDKYTNLYFTVRKIQDFQCRIKDRTKYINAENDKIKEFNTLHFSRYLHYNITSLTTALPGYKSSLEYIDISPSVTSPAAWVYEVDSSLKNPKIKLMAKGTSASYLISNDQNQPLAIFKPSSQATGGENNPKGNLFKDSYIDRAAINEYAARLVGGDDCSIPDVYLVNMMLDGKLEKGTLQQFIPNNGDMSTFLAKTTSVQFKHAGIEATKQLDQLTFDDQVKLGGLHSLDPNKHFDYMKEYIHTQIETLGQLDTVETQKMAIHDILVQNFDRLNPQNTLHVHTGTSHKLIPIDFNLAFPEQIASALPPFWIDHPSACLPLDPQVTQYVINLDIDHLKNQLTHLGMTKNQIVHFELMHLFVRMAVEANFSLFEIGTLASIYSGKWGLTNLVLEVNSQLTPEDLQSETMLEKFKDIFAEKLLRKISIMKDEIAEHGISKIATNIHLLSHSKTHEKFTLFQDVMANLNMHFLGQDVEDSCPFTAKEFAKKYDIPKITVNATGLYTEMPKCSYISMPKI